MLRLLLTVCCLFTFSAHAGPPAGFEAAWRDAAAKFASHVQPHMSEANKHELQQGLDTSDPNPPISGQAAGPSTHPAVASAKAPLPGRMAGPSTHPAVASAKTSFFVSPDKAACSDTGPGSKANPFCTVVAGVFACRNAPMPVFGPAGCAVYLREGTHRLAKTVVLTPDDSDLVVAGYPGEHAIVSGAQTLDSGSWAKVPNATTTTAAAATTTIWRAPVTDRPAAIDTLLVDGIRGIPARFPNADVDGGGGKGDKFPIGYIHDATQWTKPSNLGTPKYIEYNTSENFRPSYRSLFTDYRGGVGGQCSHYDPPFSYWCAETPQGGGAAQYLVPSGLTYTAKQLPNAPYAGGGKGGRITAWRPGHWANWQFQIAAAPPPSSGLRSSVAEQQQEPSSPASSPASASFAFAKGGFQGGRGNARGAEWFVSHVREELDFPREYWYNASEGALYFVSGTATIDCQGDPNCNSTRTQQAPAASTFEVSTLKALFEVRGTQAEPVTGITFSSLTFTGSSETFLDPHGVPSGGDWALQRSAALFFEGTINATLEGCELIRLDGNAVMLSGFNQYANISHNTFLSTGATAVALWGYSNGTHPLQPEGTGPDGTEGNFPRWTTVHGNFFRHLGVHEKQSSCLFQAKAAQSKISSNICFDVPRAGFNLNDGFGGGHDIYQNLLFQTCGESGDHGAINTWDRQSFITTIATGKPSIVPAVTAIHHNFIVSDYDANGGMVDNDDGSSFYDEFSNFGVYGGAKFGNIDGHGKKSHGNVYAFPNVYGKSCFWHWPGWFPVAGYEEQFFNNTCIMDGAGQNYISMPNQCSLNNASSVHLVTHDNRVFAPSANAVVSGCGSKATAFAKWMKVGVDHGTTLAALPSNEAVIAMGLAVLGV